jgi:hypothetical protein
MGGPSSSSENTNQQITAQQEQLAATASGESSQLFNTTFPGAQTAENYYQTLASGNPQALMQANAPAINSLAANTAQAKNNITATMPRGGAQSLALDQADITKSAQVGNLESSTFTNSFPALASLAGQGTGLSINSLSNAIGGLAGASQSNSNLMGAQAEGKGSTMGFLGSLAGAGAQVGAAFAP